MRKSNFMILTLNVVVLVLGLVCSGVGVVSYVAAQNPNGTLLSTTTPDPLTTPTVLPSPTPEATPIAEAGEEQQIEYYRGMFDLCMATWQNSMAPREQIVDNCRKLVSLAIEQNWFDAPSYRWQWPIPERLSHNFEQG